MNANSTTHSRSKSATVAECEAVLAHHAKSFRWAAAFLSPLARERAAIAYAYCRKIDDAVDEAPSEEVARRALLELDSQLEGRSSPDPILSLYKEMAEECGFGLNPARDLLLGADSDLGKVRVESDEELLTYCYRVAGTVGLMMCGILEVTDSDARQPAIDLGVAMQLTNICRDVLEDAQRGRVYLPQQRLAAAGTTPEALLRFARTGDLDPHEMRNVRKAVRVVVQDLLKLADEKYRNATVGFHFLPTRARLAILVASGLYRHIGVQLLDRGDGDPLNGRTSVSSRTKLLLTFQAFGAWMLGLTAGVRGRSAITSISAPRSS